MVTCDIGKDRCSVTNMGLPMGLTLNIKTCVSSDVCDKGVQVINMGQLGKAVAQLKCCEGVECKHVVPPELPKKAPVNGKQCPACFAMGSTCHEEVANCIGDELYCAEGVLSSESDIIPLEVILKGCANEALCDSLAGYEAMAPENSGDHTMQCTPNSSVYQQEFSAVGINTIPRWFGLFITILSGILLRELLA
uniref:Phospholipase A2 inhibitor N-terminal domain-containing protein n=1 Tax=Micrurus carvalhoi TaxID=3147026 RepID=A0A2H6NBN6_9SAUR